MNWKHVKNFFLILLAVVNLLLFYFVYTDYSETAFTDPITAAHAVSILEEDGIHVLQNLLTVKNDDIPSLSASYTREMYLLAAAKFYLGKEPNGIFLLPDGIRAETTDGEVVYLKNNLSVSYRAKAGGITAATELQKNRLVPFAKEAKAAIMSTFAEVLNLPTEAIAAGKYLQGDNCVFLILTQTENGIPLHNMTCTFGLLDGRIVYAEGRHFLGAPEKMTEAPLLNRVNILLSEGKRGVTGTVTDITLCYALYEQAEAALLQFVPAYAIHYASGNISVVNAISGEAVQTLE